MPPINPSVPVPDPAPPSGARGEIGPAAICTVVSKNYLAYARTLGESLRKHHPDIPFFVLLVDRVEDRFDLSGEPFRMLLAEDLKNIAEPESFFFKYDITELNTAVKPFFFEHLFQTYGLRKLIYFDPDILVFAPLTRIWDLLDEHSAVLTPHITRPIEDARLPGEVDLLRAGVFNLGFIALSRAQPAREFLAWWRERLYHHCVIDHDKGYFVDQKWVDLAPSLFEGFHTLTDPAYNVAYWNFHERAHGVEMRDPERVLLNGKPLVFFHFSGFNTDRLEKISKYQNRFLLSDLPNLRPVYELYRERLVSHGHEAARRWPYAYGSFDNGVPIPNVARKLYREMGERARRFGNPFAAGTPGGYFAWLTESAKPSFSIQRASSGIPRLWWEIHKTQPALEQAFPEPFTRDRADFCAWIHTSGTEIYDDVTGPFLPAEGAPAVPPPRSEMSQEAPQDRMSAPMRRVLGAPLRMLLRNRPELLDQMHFWAIGATKSPFRRPAAFPPRAASSARQEVSAWGRGLPFGVNVTGYLAGEFGIAEASRGLVHALQTTPIPVALNNIVVDNKRYEDTTFSDFTDDNPYSINLVTVNADMVAHTLAEKGPEWFRNRYNIGVWYWELSRFPENLWPSFEPFHEIWVTSAFCAEAIAQVSPIPVVKITYPLRLDEAAVRPDRARFDIPEAAFTFLFSFDFHSFMERKNPLAVIEAFRQAFGTGGEKALLLIKSINSEHYPDRAAQMRQAAQGLNVRFLDAYLSRADTLSLLASCDCLTSLHRSEGLGLGMAEAMRLGKPVIATAYSGNMDFMNINNSLPVRYRLVELTEDHGPYTRGNVWADPDIAHAAEQMRRVYENPDVARRIGERAAEDIRTRHSVAVAGREIQARLERILSL